MRKVNQLGPFVKVLGTVSAVMFLGLASVYVYQSWMQVQ